MLRRNTIIIAQTKAILFFLPLMLAIFCAPFSAHALLEINIDNGTRDPIPVAVPTFESDSRSIMKIAADITDLLAYDLSTTGFIRMIDENAYLERPVFEINPTFINWRKVQASMLVTGKVMDMGSKIRVSIKMWDPYIEKNFDNVTYVVNKNAWRRVSHKVADRIYKKLTGDTGYFDSRVVFIAESGRYKKTKTQLAIMDADGGNVKILTSGRDLVLSPRFDNKNHRITYTSFKNRTAEVFLYDLVSGNQRMLGRFSGMSFASRFAPDGNHIIFSVANNGSTSIYEMNIHSKGIRKITTDAGSISTSPSYSPDGKYIVFSSDRTGRQQLYVIPRSGGNPLRISNGAGSYATPVWSPRGDYIAFTKILRGTFYIGLMRPDGKGERLITSAWLVEGPTWSPNGRLLMFFDRDKRNKATIYSIHTSGHNKRRIPLAMSASDPAWSPLLPD